MAEKTDRQKSIHAGHRQRMKDRLRREGLSSFSEHEVLELLLMYAIPQKDVNPLAHELIARFGSLNNVLNADESELMRVSGVGSGAALLLSMMPELMRYYHLNSMGEKPVITNYAQAKAYCQPLFVGAKEEHAYMVCLDQRGHVLHLALMYRGTIDEVMLYPRRIVEMAIRHNAYVVVLAHNHPGGMAFPSQADQDTTRKLAEALGSIGIRLADHLIFAGNHSYSMMRMSGSDEGTPESFSYVTHGRARLDSGKALKEETPQWIALNADDLHTAE